MESKLVIKNPSVEGFNPQEGFLTELWQNKGDLPRLNKVGKVIYILREGFRNLSAAPTSIVISITTVAASVFLLGAVILLVSNISSSIAKTHDSLAFTVYFSELADDVQVTSFLDQLSKNKIVKSVNFVSKDEAMNKLKQDLGQSRDFLDGLDADNPLPRSADIFFASGNQEEIDGLFSDPIKKGIIEDYSNGSPFISSFKRLMNIFGFLAKVGIVISELVVIFLIANTIKLLIYSRRDEILIMQLIGASDWLIQVPFLISGAAQGVIGAILGLTVLKLAFWAVTFELKSFDFFTVVDHPILFISPIYMVLIILMCAAIGCIGSYFSIGKFLDV